MMSSSIDVIDARHVMFFVYYSDYVTYDDAMAHAASIAQSALYGASSSKTLTILSYYPVHLSQGSL